MINLTYGDCGCNRNQAVRACVQPMIGACRYTSTYPRSAVRWTREVTPREAARTLGGAVAVQPGA